MVFFLLLFLLLLSEIFIPNGFVKLSWYLTILIPVILSVISVWSGKKITVPRVSIYYLLFLAMSGISAASAVNREIAVEYFLIYTAAFLIFIFSYNFKESIKQHLSGFLIFISIFSTILFLINFIFEFQWFAAGSSLFYSGYYHNEIAGIILLGIISAWRNYPVFVFLLTPLFLFSYSRSAYLALIGAGFLDKKIYRNIGALILLSIVGLFFLFTTREFRTFLPKKLSRSLEKKLLVPENKSLLGERHRLFGYAIRSIAESPLLGVGPGNFYYAASRQQVNWAQNSTTAHNIILDIFSENGILAGLFFLIFVCGFLRKSEKNSHFIGFISLSLMFLTGFTHRYNFFLILWFVMAGVTLGEDGKIKFSIPVITMILFILSQTVLIGEILYLRGEYKKSLFIYPIKRDAFESSIDVAYKQKNMKEAKKLINGYEFMYGREFYANLKIARHYELILDHTLAVHYYKKYFENRGIAGAGVLERILKLEGKEKFQIYINHYLKSFKSEYTQINKIIKIFCDDNMISC